MLIMIDDGIRNSYLCTICIPYPLPGIVYFFLHILKITLICDNFPRDFILTYRSVLGHYRLEIYRELTSGVNIHIAQANSIIQRIFENYKGKMYFLVNSNLRVQNKLLGKIENGEMITEVLTLLLTPILPIL